MRCTARCRIRSALGLDMHVNSAVIIWFPLALISLVHSPLAECLHEYCSHVAQCGVTGLSIFGHGLQHCTGGNRYNRDQIYMHAGAPLVTYQVCVRVQRWQCNRGRVWCSAACSCWKRRDGLSARRDLRQTRHCAARAALWGGVSVTVTLRYCTYLVPYSTDQPQRIRSVAHCPRPSSRETARVH